MTNDPLARLRHWLDRHPDYTVDFEASEAACLCCPALASTNLTLADGRHRFGLPLCDTHLSRASRLIADHARKGQVA